MRLLRAWLPPAAYMGLSWYLSSLPSAHVPSESFPFHDKGLHFVEYAMLGLLLALAALQTWPDRAKWRLAAVAIVVATGWGVLDEFHQAFVPTRSPDLHDIVADILGSSAGAITLFIVVRLRRAATAVAAALATSAGFGRW